MGNTLRGAGLLGTSSKPGKKTRVYMEVAVTLFRFAFILYIIIWSNTFLKSMFDFYPSTHFASMDK